jgi:hypothetical protein
MVTRCVLCLRILPRGPWWELPWLVAPRTMCRKGDDECWWLYSEHLEHLHDYEPKET